MKNFQSILVAVCMLLSATCQSQTSPSMSRKNSAPAKLENQFSDLVVGKQNSDLLQKLLSDDFISHHFPAPGMNSKEVFIGGMKGLFSGFPDIKVTRVNQIEKDDKVFTYAFWEGTNKGEFMGILATNKTVHVEYMDIWRVKNGKLVENWVVMDIIGLMKQLGVVK